MQKGIVYRTTTKPLHKISLCRRTGKCYHVNFTTLQDLHDFTSLLIVAGNRDGCIRRHFIYVRTRMLEVFDQYIASFDGARQQYALPLQGLLPPVAITVKQ